MRFSRREFHSRPPGKRAQAGIPMLGFDRWQLLKTLSAILTIAGLV
jgi:hypothetical protein